MRIKLIFPDPELFRTTIAVTVADINYGGHMGNDRFLTLMQETRLRWLSSIGFKDEKEIAPPVGIIVVDAAIQYKAEVFHGEELIMSLAANEITEKSFDLYYQILSGQGNQVAIGKTGIVCFNYNTRKVSSIPEALLKSLK